MDHEIILPCEELKDFVSHFWAAKWNIAEKTNSAYFATANIQTELAFGFRTSPGNRYPQLLFSSILGHTEKFRQFPMETHMDLFGVSLYAHAIPCFFNISTSELTDQLTDLDTLNNQGRMINDKISTALSTQQRVKILSDYFKSRLMKKRFEDITMIRAIKEIRKAHGILHIKTLASEFCLSQKQFERRFAGYSGFNPKLFARIIRFETALWDRKNYSTLTEVAHAYGYYDQAHFIRDFKTFSGFSPNKFFAVAGY
jgi:AraC-like DNA-binding protein